MTVEPVGRTGFQANRPDSELSFSEIMAAVVSVDRFAEEEVEEALEDSAQGNTGHNEGRKDVDHSEELTGTADPLVEKISELSEMVAEEEAWKDSVKKCRRGKAAGQIEAEDFHHSEYLETSDPQLEGVIKEMIRIMFEDSETSINNYPCILSQLLHDEYDNLKRLISALEGSEQDLPHNLWLASVVTPKPLLLKQYHQALKICEQKQVDRERQAMQYFYKELDYVTKEIIRKIDGVVRVQRKGSTSREHGTGTGIVVRLNRSDTYYTPRHNPIFPKRHDFAILTSNHVVANDTEVQGSTIDFFYNAAAGNEVQGCPPLGVVTKSVTHLITLSPRVPGGTQASHEKMDFSILEFDVGTDQEFINKLGDVSFYLNEFLDSLPGHGFPGFPDRPLIPFTRPLPLVAIGHPHGSNKRISFGKVSETEVDKLCSQDDDHYSTKYDLTTCFGSSGCPVLAIQVNSKGHMRAVLQFLHFKTGCGINVSKVYSACKSKKEIADQFWLFESPLNSREMMYPTRSWPVWWDESDQGFWGLR